MAWTERYVSVAGGGAHDGTSEANAWTLAEAIAGSNAGERMNVIAGTYANTTTDRTFAAGTSAATTTAPKWWRGYKTTIGDMDSAPAAARTPGTDIPEFTWTTGFVSISGVHQTFSNISFTGARTAGQVFISGTFLKFLRCRFEDTAANAGAFAIQFTAATSNGPVFQDCYFKATTTASIIADCNDDVTFRKCVFEGGGIGVDVAAGLIVIVDQCVFNNLGSDGVNCSGAPYSLTVLNSSFYSVGGNGVDFAALPTAYGIVAGSIFSECGAYGINNSSGANTNIITRVGNLFYSNTSGNETGFGDSPSFYDQTDSASPFTNGGSSDLSLISTSNGKANASPGLFENQTYTSYLDIGAVQRQEAASSGGFPVLGGPFT